MGAREESAPTKHSKPNASLQVRGGIYFADIIKWMNESGSISLHLLQHLSHFYICRKRQLQYIHIPSGQAPCRYIINALSFDLFLSLLDIWIHNFRLLFRPIMLLVLLLLSMPQLFRLPTPICGALRWFIIEI